MKLLDLFCGAGGAAVGYHRAGFEVVGVDINPQPRYPFEFHRGDALEFVAKYGKDFDVIHASPPCQRYTQSANLPNVNPEDYPDLVGSTRKALSAERKPYIIENVPGAPLINPLVLCGSMFGLKTRRHRLFETNPPIYWPPISCNHNGKTVPIMWGDKLKAGIVGGEATYLDRFDFVTVAGNAGLKADYEIAMGIDWMTKSELSEAIPPAYTEWLGKRILESV